MQSVLNNVILRFGDPFGAASASAGTLHLTPAPMCIRFTIALLAVGILLPANLHAATYQFVVREGDRNVYLWVPPACDRIRGLIAAFRNLTEQRWLEDNDVRAAAAENCLGIVWIGSGKASALDANMSPDASAAFLTMQADLARVSGFPEIASAPILPAGHSAHGQFAWKFAERFPERTIAALPIKTVPLPADLDLQGVPLLYIVGQTTEWPQFRDGSRPGNRDFFWPVVRDSALAIRHRDPDARVGVAVDPGGGHFDWSPAMTHTVATFIRAVCHARLPAKARQAEPADLRPVPLASGWLADTGGMEPDKLAPSPFAQFRGKPADAYWFLNQAVVKQVETMQGDRIARKVQMLSFEQDGRTLPVAKEGFAALRFEPETDGIHFSLHPVFLSAVPQELVGAGKMLGHAGVPIRLSVTSGPVEQTGPDLFVLAWQREALGGEAWIEEEASGDRQYRKAVQPGKLIFPKLSAGAAQSITVAQIIDQPAGAQTIALNAKSNSGLPVHFFVESGPAEIEGDHLRITDIPRGNLSSIQVTVVAYQPGRLAGNGLTGVQSADPVTLRFRIAKQPTRAALP